MYRFNGIESTVHAMPAHCSIWQTAKPNERKSDAENCYRGKEVTAQPTADWDFEYLLMVIV